MKAIKAIFLIILWLLWGACIDRLNFDTGDFERGILVVDGQITDEPGPYSIKIFRSSTIDDILNFKQVISAKSVTIIDDTGYQETLREREIGLYETAPNGIRGEIGRTYKIKIELNDGSIFESTDETLQKAGKIDSLYWEFESYNPSDAPTQYGFRIFLDAIGRPGDDYFVRWKFKGTYKVETNPELHERCPCDPDGYPDPRECSGVIYYNNLYLKRIGPCTCCTCWVNQFENKPVVRDNSLVVNELHRKVEVGYVPMNEWTFFSNKYLVEVKQMSLTRNAYEFLKTIQDQKEGSESLFQPSFGKAPTNIHNTNGDKKALGFFYASSVDKKTLWLTAKDVPISIPVPLLKIKESCLVAFPNSFTEEPEDWK